MIENKRDRNWRRAGLLPALLLYGGLAVLPVMNLFWSSFLRIDWAAGAEQRAFAGLGNYARLPQDSFYGVGVINTVVFAVVTVLIQMVLGFALALIVSRSKIRSQLYRTIIILPILIPGIVVGAIWRLMFDSDFGVLNQMLGMVGLGPYTWIATPWLARLSIVIVDVWHWTPFVFLLLYAGVQGLPEDVFEAARVDGTAFWRELRHITMPLMMPTLVVTLMFRIILAFKVFDEIYLLTSGGPGTATEVISFSIFRTYFIQNDIGYGSAMSFITMFVVAVLIVVSLGVQRVAGREA